MSSAVARHFGEERPFDGPLWVVENIDEAITLFSSTNAFILSFKIGIDFTKAKKDSRVRTVAGTS